MTLPLAPLRGVVWIAEQVQELSERETSDPIVMQQRLREAQQDYEDGLITATEYMAFEEWIVQRLLSDRSDQHAEVTGDRRDFTNG